MVDDRVVEDFLEHAGVKGMRWGHRKPRDEAARARQFGGHKDKKLSRRERKAQKVQAQTEAKRAFVAAVLKDVNARPMNELYITTGQQGRMMQTGAEVVEAMNTGVTITSLNSAGYRIGD